MYASRTNSQRKANPSLKYISYEEEGTRRKEGKEEHEGRGCSDWLQETKFPHPQSCPGHPKTTPSILHTTLASLHKPLEFGETNRRLQTLISPEPFELGGRNSQGKLIRRCSTRCNCFRCYTAPLDVLTVKRSLNSKAVKRLKLDNDAKSGRRKEYWTIYLTR